MHEARDSSQARRALARVWPELAALLVASLFWIPSFRAGRGYFPAPLDDVYIHFDFAKTLAQGHLFEWIAGQGYSSGETSPLYAVTLAVGWLVGFRGAALGAWAALVTVFALGRLIRAVKTLARPCRPWLTPLVALVPVSVALVDWTLVSGMEMALFSGALGEALVRLDLTRKGQWKRRGRTRERTQWELGMWGAVLCLLRPEASVLVFVFAIVAARGAGPRSGLAAVVRSSTPGACAVLLVLAANVHFTGRAPSAGAELKLLSSLPYLSERDRARAYVENLVTFVVKGAWSEVGGTRTAALVVPLLATFPLASRSKRPVVAACLLGSLAYALLVSWNHTAPFHNFRYYAPSLVLLLVATALGLAELDKSRRTRPLALLVTLGFLASASVRFPEQIRHFRRSVANIRDQQIEGGLRLRTLTPPDARILLGDAGAIPFVSERSAIDALGLGGYHALPFARAAVFGEGSIVELIERLAPGERPTHLALYPNWFGSITRGFGVEIDRVTITDNIICGGTTKGLYSANWSVLDDGARKDPQLIDEIDVADVVSEAEHGYQAPLPHGFVNLDVRALSDGTRRFDGGRTIQQGESESFHVRAPFRGRARIVLRVDDEAEAISLRTPREAPHVTLEPPRGAAWRTAHAEVLDLREGDALVVEAVRAYRDYHVWIQRVVAP